MQAKASMFGGRLPKQLQRALPIYASCALIVLFIVHLSSVASSPVVDVLRRDSSHQSTVSINGPLFPRKIWQTWRIDAPSFEEREKNTARTWMLENPSYRYEVLTDSNGLQYVETNFGPSGLNRSDIVEMYRSLTAKIVKADLLRYLIMYMEGGLYTDIDVAALKPIARFIPDTYDEREIDMVIGVEIDEPRFRTHPILGNKSESFCQWTFMSKPSVPVMMRLVNNILTWLNDVSERQNVTVSDIVLDFNEVIEGTGPTAFTNAILAEMTAKTGHEVTWTTFHNMRKPKLIGGVLVLPVEAFCAGQGHSNSGTHESPQALVLHHYHASGWPVTHPRYKHPVYGEIEMCNWDAKCVNDWDAKKAAFEALAPEEQAKLIADKEAADALSSSIAAATRTTARTTTVPTPAPTQDP